jgi:hypothetical protein
LLVAWRTDDDTFEEGQWLSGRVYERRCDLSPNGNYLLYFAAKWKEPLASWTAVSRPPYFTAIALWPKGDAWGGGGLFDDDRTIRLNHRATQLELAPEFHLPRRMKVCGLVPPGYGEGEDGPVWETRLRRDGWTMVQDGKSKETQRGAKVWIEYDPPCIYAKPRPGAPRTVLRMIVHGLHEREGPWYVTDHEVLSPKRTIALPQTEWADWDRQGDLLYASGGALHRLDPASDAPAKRLIDLNDRTFVNRPPKARAREWF